MLFVLCATSLSCADGTAVPDCTADMDAEVCAVFQLVNQERVSRGLAPYAWSPRLAVASQRHAEDMFEQDYFSHTSLDGRDFGDRADDAGYDGSPRGENIASGQRSAESVMNSWMNSTGHRNNILSASSNEIGIGLHQFYWVQNFGFTNVAP
jgi:uncharacterized protein YkwD